jgi:hypothetical protein
LYQSNILAEWRQANEDRQMRKATTCFQVILISMLALLAAGCSTTGWHYDYDLAMRSAVEQRRRAVVVFGAGTNSDSREMDWKVLNDAKVREMLREFIPVRQDFYLHSLEARELGVTEVPTVVVVRPDGTIAGSQSGRFTPESFRFFLIKNRFN